MSFTAVTVSGTYLRGPGQPASGSVSFQLSSPITDGTVTIGEGAPIVATLDNTGSFSMQLFALDDSTTSPTGVVWRVTESISTPKTVSRGFNISLSKTATSVNIAALAPVVAQIPGFQYLTVQAANAAYVAPAGKTTSGSAAPLISFNVADYGLKADNGTTDNSPLITAMLAAIPEASIVWWPTNGTNEYAFDSQVNVTKTVAFVGNHGRDTSSGAVFGSLLVAKTAAAFAPNLPIFNVTTARTHFEGLALLGALTTETAATTTSGSNVIQLSTVTAASWMVGCPVGAINGQVTGHPVPQFKDRTTHITAVNTGSNQITISENCTAGASGVSLTISSGQGIQWGAGSHYGSANRCLIQQFATSWDLAANSDHISAHRCEFGSYDNVVYEAGNQFDYSFVDCLNVGALHSCERLAANTSVVNVSRIRTHRGFSPFGVTQDATTNGDGYAGCTDVASPIEQISQQHISIVNSLAAWDIDAACYWTWNGTPTVVGAFEISGSNSGPISFRPQLAANTPNANCGAVIVCDQPGNQASQIATYDIGLNGFAAIMKAAYAELVLSGPAFLNGSLTMGGPTTLTTNGFLTVAGALITHSVSKTGAYSTTQVDTWVRATSGSWTLTLTQNTNEQIVIVTNEGAGTITMATSAGSYVGPATITAGRAGIFISDGTNFRCVAQL